MWIERQNKDSIIKSAKSRPAILLTGARQTGKSSLIKRLFPKAEYLTLDRIAIAREAEENPSIFLNGIKSQVILDEVQYAPSLFRELKILIDENRTTYGKWILTGSQKFLLMKNITESLAGRIAIHQLESLSAKELRYSVNTYTPKDYLWKGGYPELWSNPELDSRTFLQDYIQTYLKRDLKEIINVNNLYDFQRFIVVCAVRVGQLINFSDIAKDIGVSAKTIRHWISALEASCLIYILPPYYANIGKRLIKAPKLYFADHGLLCSILNIDHFKAWQNHPMRGSLWENFVLCEMIKTHPLQPGGNLFFYRDQNNVEIDFVTESNNELTFIEAKSAEIIDPKKLNFKKVLKYFPDKKTSCMLACMHTENKIMRYKDYDMVNPLIHDFELS